MHYPACIYMSDKFFKCLAVCLSSCTVSMWVLIAICHSCTVITLVTAVKAACLLDSDYSMQTAAAYAHDSRDTQHFWLLSSSLYTVVQTLKKEEAFTCMRLWRCVDMTERISTSPASILFAQFWVCHTMIKCEIWVRSHKLFAHCQNISSVLF